MPKQLNDDVSLTFDNSPDAEPGVEVHGDEQGQDPSLEVDPASQPDEQLAADEQVPEEADGADPVSVVGDSRRLIVYAWSTNYLVRVPIGEAWQDENGLVCGDGICHMMLFEPYANQMYQNASIGMDVSPLQLFATRLAMSPFVGVEWANDQ